MMKKTILSLLALFVAIMAWGDNVTAQQALQQAQSFIKQREDAGSRPKRIKGSAASQLTMTKQVSGLYVFNVVDNGGFVIVSNDDSTVPILGFGDSGAIDPDNMPSNMRAWLQGYADEIAWAKKHPTKSKTAAKAPRRVGSHSTAAIAPMVTTTWDQDAPYNNLCPYYSSGNKAITGCVATAMAQVMKYHEWPQAATAPIPGYTTASYKLELSSLPATTFDWANMKDSYSGSYTNAQATAVATLMQYCGWSVEMNYGPSSGSNTDLVAKALRDYYDYNTSTTQFVIRSFYSADQWTDIIYHELASGRPVVYGGSSSDNGHEFVCDGYKYESGTDFFHINWGWSGMSDNYFVLSALDPDEQGLGGSSSTDGYHYGQDAVVGIQPSTSSGTTADITPNVISLKLNSITPARNPVLVNTEVNITMNITNKSADDYDGDIFLGQKINDDDYCLLVGSNYTIPAGETKDIVIPFTPTSTGTYEFVFYWPNSFGSYSTNCVVAGTMNVIESVTNKIVPIYGLNCDNYSRSQFIIPATDLQDMGDAIVSGVTFFSSSKSVSWGNAEFDVYLKEVSETTLSSLISWETLEKVYAGKLSVKDNKMVITFDTPYHYQGGNLLVGINQTTTGLFKSCSWIGTTVTGASMGGYGSTISQQNFLPATTFEHKPGPNATPKPTNIVVKPSGTSATVTWTNNSEYATGYNLRYRTAEKSAAIFEDDFENGLGQWTIYTEGEAGGSDGWYTMNPNNGLEIDAHSGNYVASAWSWNGVEYNADNWLVTPQVVFGKTLKFWVRVLSSYPDKYEVLLSTTGNAISDFKVTLQAMNPGPTNGAWNEVVIDLSAYAGQQGYIAIHHQDYDNNYLLIDDFGIYDEAAPAGEWQTTSATTTSKVLTGLTPLTTYELQLQGVYPGGTSDWTSTTTFTTTYSSVLAGDANGDGKVDMADAVAIWNKILGNPPGGFVEAAADVNHDGKITVSDAVGVVDIILSGAVSAPAMHVPQKPAPKVMSE